MATWITKPWIENALSADSLPKIAKAQVLKLEQTSNNSAIIAIISDKKLFVKARFSPTAIEEFERDTCNTSLAEIQGGLIFVKKYSVSATAEVELDQAEFVINIDHFKFAGGEGNTQFGTDLVDSSTLPQLQSRLRQLWRIGQLRIQFDDAQEEANFPDTKKTKRLLLKSHDSVYIPKDMERKLAEIAEWKPSYCPPHTCTSEIQSCSSSTQMQICAESAESAERETEEKEIEKHTCMSQEHNEKRLVSSSYVPSSQKRHRVLVDQPLKGLVPEELCSSSSETSQLRGSSEESYSILQGRSSHGGKAPDVSIVPSSQNSHEFEIEQPLSHVTPERTQFHCSLSESQLGQLLDSNVSFDAVTSPLCISDGLSPMQEGFTQLKPRNACQKESICNDHTPVKRKSLAESSNSRNAVFSQPCLASNHILPGKESPLGNKSSQRNITCQKNVLKNVGREVAVSSPSKGNVGHTLTRKEILEKAKIDFDALFIQNTWNHSQTPVQEFSADLFEIDRRLSTKRKRSQTDDSVRKTRSSGGVKQENKLLLPDSPVSPDSTSCSVKSSSQSGSSQSQRSNHSISMAGLEDLYSQQDGLFLDTSGSTGSHKSPQEHCSTSPSILGNAIEEPCSLSTPNFDSLPSYQVPAGDKGTPSNVIFLSPMARDRRGELSAENKRNRLNVTSPPMTSDQGDELLPCSTSRTRKREAENHQEPGTSWNFVEKALKTGSSKQKRKTKARRKFNWFSDAY
ncbi:uncharacterized protein LOC144649723 isoform X1 [Oculina patagonica]